MLNVSLANISPILQIDKLIENGNNIILARFCPLSDIKEDDIESKEIVLESIRKLLFGMNVLDELFTEITGFKRHIYILGDGTIFNFVAKNIIHNNINNVDKSYYLEIICTLGLSYRFNVAKKFGYSDTNVMQLRLNGWGRAYCFSEKNVNDYQKLKKDIYKYWFPIISKHKKEYTDLVMLCDSTERPLEIDRIQSINKTLPIKLVT